MDVTPLIAKGQNVIKSYSENSITINETKYHCNLLLFPDEIIELPADLSIENIIENYQDMFQIKDIEILLIGTGQSHIFPDKALKEKLNAQTYSVDHMQTGAACRTYNVLLTEGRNLAAIILSVSFPDHAN